MKGFETKTLHICTRFCVNCAFLEELSTRTTFRSILVEKINAIINYREKIFSVCKRRISLTQERTTTEFAKETVCSLHSIDAYFFILEFDRIEVAPVAHIFDIAKNVDCLSKLSVVTYGEENRLSTFTIHVYVYNYE